MIASNRACSASVIPRPSHKQLGSGLDPREQTGGESEEHAEDHLVGRAGVPSAAKRGENFDLPGQIRVPGTMRCRTASAPLSKRRTISSLLIPRASSHLTNSNISTLAASSGGLKRILAKVSSPASISSGGGESRDEPARSALLRSSQTKAPRRLWRSRILGTSRA